MGWWFTAFSLSYRPGCFCQHPCFVGTKWEASYNHKIAWPAVRDTCWVDSLNDELTPEVPTCHGIKAVSSVGWDVPPLGHANRKLPGVGSLTVLSYRFTCVITWTMFPDNTCLYLTVNLASFLSALILLVQFISIYCLQSVFWTSIPVALKCVKIRTIIIATLLIIDRL